MKHHIQQLVDQLQHILPYERLLQDLHADLDTNPEDPVLVEVETGFVQIPKRVVATEIAKVMQYDSPEQEVGFRAVLAVGGITKYRNGVITPGICFARLHYNEDGECASVDYYVSYGR